jgi:hypothetical protein
MILKKCAVQDLAVISAPSRQVEAKTLPEIIEEMMLSGTPKGLPCHRPRSGQFNEQKKREGYF